MNYINSKITKKWHQGTISAMEMLLVEMSNRMKSYLNHKITQDNILNLETCSIWHLPRPRFRQDFSFKGTQLN